MQAEAWQAIFEHAQDELTQKSEFITLTQLD